MTEARLLCLAVVFPWIAAALTVTSSPNPSKFGDPVTIIGDISASPAGMKVIFWDGATQIGAGSALTIPTLSPGIHTLRADYYIGGSKIGSAQTTQTVTSTGSSNYNGLSSQAVPGTPLDIALMSVPGLNTTAYVVACGTSIYVDKLPIYSASTFSPGSAAAPAVMTFPATYNVNAYQVLIVDVTGDGIPDLVALDNATGFRVLAGNGDGTFQPPSPLINVTPTPVRMAAADFNSDGRIDIAIVDTTRSVLAVVFNNGDGTFSAPVTYSVPLTTGTIATADLTGDGIADILVASSRNFRATLFPGSSSGVFRTSVPVPLGTFDGPLDIRIVDVSGDGIPDIVAAGDPQDFVSVVKGNGDGTFQSPLLFQAGLQPQALAVADLNGDQIPDIATVNSGDGAMSILYGTGGGHFQNAISYSVGSGPAALVPAAMNLYGRVEFLVARPAAGSLSEVLSQPIGCTYTLSNSSLSFQASGGSGSVLVTSPVDCGFGFTSNSSWIAISTSKSFLGSVVFNVAANTNAAPRIGSLTIAGQTVTINQAGAGCQFILSPGSAVTTASGGSGSFIVSTTGSDCQWTAVSAAPWISITSGAGSVQYTVAAGTANVARTGAISLTATTAPAQASFTIAQPGTPLEFYTVAPCRVFDTRPLAGFPAFLGGPTMASGETRTFPIAGSSCGIPANAQAYSLNVTAVPPSPGGYLGLLTTWPTGQPKPNASTLNSYTGTVVANAAIVPAGANGSIDVYVSDKADVLADINGYLAPASSSGLLFHTVVPCRVADTRPAAGFPGLLGSPTMAAGETRAFPVPSSPCALPANTSAYSLNFTVVPAGYLGLLTTWPVGPARPNASTLNSYTGTVVANAAIVPAGTGGAIDVYVSDKADVLFDANGYFVPQSSGGLNFYPSTPCRLVDTRNLAGFPPLFGPPGLAAGQTRTFPIPSGPCGIPGSAGAYSLNITVLPAGYLGALTAWPAGHPRPNASTLNSYTGT